MCPSDAQANEYYTTTIHMIIREFTDIKDVFVYFPGVDPGILEGGVGTTRNFWKGGGARLPM